MKVISFYKAILQDKLLNTFTNIQNFNYIYIWLLMQLSIVVTKVIFIYGSSLKQSTL